MRNNGYRVREVDASEIPEHILKSLKRLQPNESDCLDGLTSDDWETASSSDNGSVWVLQCPADVNLSDLIKGKKLSLDGKRLLLEDGGDENGETESSTIRHRKFEAVSVSRKDFKEGVVLLLPDNDNFKLVSAPVQGHIIIRESLKQLEVPTLKVPPPIVRELPSGIKERHPVYGADFTDILKEMEESPVKKKNKKKSHKAEPEPPQFTKLTLSFNDAQNYNTDNDYTSPTDKDSRVKKKKKKKREHDDDTSFSLEKSNDSINISELASFSEVRVKKEKKSKKRKREEMEQFEASEQDLLTNDDVPSTKKSKKHKH